MWKSTKETKWFITYFPLKIFEIIKEREESKYLMNDKNENEENNKLDEEDLELESKEESARRTKEILSNKERGWKT